MQEKGKLSLDKVDSIFKNKSITSIKRSIANINYYLPESKRMFIGDSVIYSYLDYNDFLRFINFIKLKDYLSSTKERLKLIILCTFIFETVNTSKLYDDIGVSLSTKKKDTKELKKYLIENHLDIEIVNRKGIRIIGDEARFRILVLNIIFSISELNRFHQLSSRTANNPYERLMFQYVDRHFKSQNMDLRTHFNLLLKSHSINLSYVSKKLLFIYLLIAKTRINLDWPLNENIDLPIIHYQSNLFEQQVESVFLSRFIDSLDHDKHVENVIDWQLSKKINNFVKSIQVNIITQISHHQGLNEELYSYIHKSLIRNYYRYNIFDNNLASTFKYYTNLFNLVQQLIQPIEQDYKVKFDNNQLSTITLILRKYIINNKITGRNLKPIAIVTNSAVEKIDFFVAHLRSYVEIGEYIAININEIYKINQFPYSLIITFSNRIAMLLNESSLPNLKLNYHLQPEDIDKLISLGFSNNLNRKIDAQLFCQDVTKLAPEELRAWLLQHYPSHFI